MTEQRKGRGGPRTPGPGKRQGRPPGSTLRKVTIPLSPDAIEGKRIGAQRYVLSEGEVTRRLLAGLARNDKETRRLYDSLILGLHETKESVD